LAHRLAHPKWNVEKEYIAVVEGVFDLSKEEIDKLAKEGLLLKKDNYQTKPFKIEVLELDKENNRSKISITITEGKHHIVKRIMKELGFPVLYLKRVRIGNLKLDENLQEGEYRELTEEEIKNLKKLVKLTEVKDG
jgi:16S rRNA pseudouridine516 synthase